MQLITNGTCVNKQGLGIMSEFVLIVSLKHFLPIYFKHNAQLLNVIDCLP